MDYKEKVIALLNSQELSNEQKEKLESIFPELKESEDEMIRKAIKKALQVRCDGSRIISDEPVTLEEAIAWLEKQGEQKLATWSEEDKRILSGLSRLVKDCYLNGGYALPTDEYDEYKKWLKSLRPQNMWKPSEEQMYILNWVANILLNHDGVVEEEASKKLQSLYNDLKKLREE